MAELLTPADDVALVAAGGTQTWADLDARVNRWIHLLRGHGLTAGDAVAVVAGNCKESIEVVLAALHAGLVVVPVNWHLTASEIAYVIDDSASRAVIVDAERATVVAAALSLTAGACAARLVLGDDDRDGCAAVEPLLEKASAAEPEDQVCGTTMLYTSGTTGVPKGVVNGLFRAGAPFRRVHRTLSFAGVMFGVPAAGRVLLVGPWYHSAQLFFALTSLLRGSTLVIQERFEPAALLDIIDTEQVTHCHLVPTQFVRLLRLDAATRERFDLRSLRRVWHGGGPCGVDVKRQMIAWWGPVFVEYYAATEGGIVTFIDTEEWLRRPGSVGRAVPPTEILIVDDSGAELPRNTPGRIYLRRPGRESFRYHNATEQTRQAYLEPGVFTYGEVGYKDDAGYLFLTGRAKDMVVSGGVNVYPAEVEAVLQTHPAVRDVAVLGVPDDEYGERVVAVVELEPGVIDEASVPAVLDRHCRGSLAGFKVPRSYVTQALPRDAAGKLRKATLRDLFA
jgi:long-chain acyl-CoA synthetase